MFGGWIRVRHKSHSGLLSEPANSQTSARQKFTRLTHQQFQELPTDAYDGLLRRTQFGRERRLGEVLRSSRRIKRLITLLLIPSVPFLAVRDDLYPERNLARQKLTTLPAYRSKDLSGDVFYELSRRYREFKEQVRPLALAFVISCSHTTLRLAFRTNHSMTHRRSTQISIFQILLPQDGFNLGRQRSTRSQGIAGRRSEDRQDREFLTHRPAGPSVSQL